MKVTPINPQVPQPVQRNGGPSDAKARAIAAFNQAASAPQQAGQAPESTGQNHSSEAPVSQEVSLEATADEHQTLETAVGEGAEVAPEPAKEEPLSPQHLALIRREKAIRAQAQKQEQEFKAKMAELEARESRLSQPSQTFDQSKYISKDDFRANPLKALAEANFSYV